MLYYLAFWSFAMGLVVGSFLNVVIYRMPRRESLVSPGSHCPRCGASIHWYDNVPVVSWLLLRGHCRSCHAPIALRYPMVELLTGFGFLAAFVRIGYSPAVLLAWAAIAVLVALAFIYHDLGIVLDRLILPATIIGLTASIALDPQEWWYYIAASVGAGLVALGLSLLGPSGVRFGEAKVAMFLGAVLGPWVLAAVPLALVLRTVAGIALVFWKRGRYEARTVFAPYGLNGRMRQHVEQTDKHDAKDAEVMTWL